MDEDEFNEEQVEVDELLNKDIARYCEKCGLLLDGSSREKRATIYKKYKKNLREMETCPKCKSKFSLINKKEMDKILLKKKKEELEKKDDEKSKELDKKYVKKMIIIIREKLKDIQEDLEKLVNRGEITGKRFAVLMYNLSYNVFKYYGKREELDMSWSDFRDFSKDISETILEKYEVHETLENSLEEYNKESDELYLKYTKTIAEDSLSGKTIEEAKAINDDIIKINKEIELQKKYNNYIEKNESKFSDKAQVKAENSFIDSLRKKN